VQNGLNVGPEDQSLWFYHQYLISNLLEPAGPDTIAPSLTDQERITYVQREIDEIRDLLEDYTNIKWIYEALVGYTSSLSLLAADQGANDNQDDLRHWVSQLRALDPRRAGRWTDLEKKLALA
jgi:geranylgeranyl transferase type-2 subunit alpha